MIQLTPEIALQTTRSGGKGGQNVNKVETAVIASWNIAASVLLTPEQKGRVTEKLSNRINKEGSLVVKAQRYRTQLENKEEAIQKVHELVTAALLRKKLRIASRPTKASKENRLTTKKMASERKLGRMKPKRDTHF